MYTVSEAAKKLGITRQRVQQLINAKKLKAKRVGSVWIVINLRRS